MKEIWTYSGGKLYEKAIITYTGEDLTKLKYPSEKLKTTILKRTTGLQHNGLKGRQ